MSERQQIHQLTFSDLESRCSNASEDARRTESLDWPSDGQQIALAEVRALPRFDDIQHCQLFSLSLSNDTSGFTHGIHRFPAKFVPQIPRWALNQFGGRDAVVLDPFMGSGTTLVEGLLQGGTTIGIDIDPLARLIAHAKTDLPSPRRMETVGREIHGAWSGPAGRLVLPMPDIDNFGHWFSEQAWGELQALLGVIQSLECTEIERRFLLVVFSSVLRWVSNADDQSQKTYVSGTNAKTPPEVQGAFWKSFHRALDGLRNLEVARDQRAKVIIKERADACALGLEPDSIDLIVTSPPYLDSVDYMYNQMLEYFWLGPTLGVPNRKTFNQLRGRAIGAKRPELGVRSIPEMLRELVDLDEIPKYRREPTVAYFNAMSKHFAEAYYAMRTGSRYVLVIGNSRTRERTIPLHDCLVRLAATSGLELEKACGYRVRRHYMKFPRKGRGGIILIDWIIVLRKVDRPASTPPRLPLPPLRLGGAQVAH